MTNEQLCTLAQEGDVQAQEQLVRNNLGYIRKTANELYISSNLENSELGIDRDDLIQEGSISLLRAIPRYDPDKKIKFLTYAGPAIRNAMMDLISTAFSAFEQRMQSDDKDGKESILKHHTLEGVITCNTDTFYGVGTNPVIAIFTAHEPHSEDKVCKFIDFRDDGYEVRAHVGLVEGDSAKDKRQHLLDVWFGRTEAASKFCVESTVKASDEWLHSFFYFNDEIPIEADFEKAIGDYLTFEFSMVMQNRDYLFENGGGNSAED